MGNFPQTFINTVLNCRYSIVYDGFNIVVTSSKLDEDGPDGLYSSLQLNCAAGNDFITALIRHKDWEREDEY